MDIIFRNATIVTDGLEMTGDLAVRDGVVKAIGDLSSLAAARIIPCDGKILMPGAVDLGLNLADGGVFDPKTTASFAQASRHAALGGVTTIINAVELDDAIAPSAAIKAHVDIDGSRAFVDFGYHVLLSAWTDRHAALSREAVTAGVPSFWLARNGAASPQPAPALLQAAIQNLPDESIVITSPWDAAFCDAQARGNGNGSLFNDQLEAAFVASLEPFADVGSCKILLNGISTPQALEALCHARGVCSRIAATCNLANLVYTEADGDAAPKCWPPVGTKVDQQALFAALEEGIVNAISSGHKPRTAAELATAKAQRSPIIGAPSLAHFIPAIHGEGVLKWRLSLATMSYAACSEPAKLAGLYPRKGSLQIGSDADIVLLDPSQICNVVESESFAMSSIPNPYAALKLGGRVCDVFVRGRQVVEAGELTNNAQGTFQSRRISLRG
ncbi:MAG TPA: amidohydrolase family protein [Candidatus Sumerlaeota bacterium]|nr:amidohydrolase family protein [Candidatus Sumerlaeota bacterium]